MPIQVTGKNVEAGDSFAAYVSEKIATVLGKYIGPDIKGHVRLEKARAQFRTQCSLHLRSGLTIEANGEGIDAYSSADAAVEHLETRIRRHKRRLKSHHHNGRDHHGSATEIAVPDYTVQMDHEDDEAHGSSPIIIAESERGIQEMPVSEAVMQLDVTEKPFLLFRNAGHGELNVVYRRADGNIGWIDPKSGANAGKVARADGTIDQNQG
ncbi:MAG: ribosome-associated translation inhibitor RaiA [Hyphomicrobium sp.]|jgi:ribosomal subunit interface protein